MHPRAVCGPEAENGALRKSRLRPQTLAWQPVWMVDGAGHRGRGVMPGAGLAWEEQQYKVKDMLSRSRDTQQ